MDPITVEFSNEASEALDELTELRRMCLSDVVTHAISLYYQLAKAEDAGGKVLVQNSKGKFFRYDL